MFGVCQFWTCDPRMNVCFGSNKSTKSKDIELAITYDKKEQDMFPFAVYFVLLVNAAMIS